MGCMAQLKLYTVGLIPRSWYRHADTAILHGNMGSFFQSHSARSYLDRVDLLDLRYTNEYDWLDLRYTNEYDWLDLIWLEVCGLLISERKGSFCTSFVELLVFPLFRKTRKKTDEQRKSIIQHTGCSLPWFINLIADPAKYTTTKSSCVKYLSASFIQPLDWRSHSEENYCGARQTRQRDPPNIDLSTPAFSTLVRYHATCMTRSIQHIIFLWKQNFHSDLCKFLISPWKENICYWFMSCLFFL